MFVWPSTTIPSPLGKVVAHTWLRCNVIIAFRFVVVVRFVLSIYLDGLQLLAPPPDDLSITALLAPPPGPSDPAPGEEEEFRRFFSISRFRFSRLQISPLEVAQESALALLLEALNVIPPPFPTPPTEPLLPSCAGQMRGLARMGGLIGSCLALMTS